MAVAVAYYYAICIVKVGAGCGLLIGLSELLCLSWMGLGSAGLRSVIILDSK